MTKLHAPTAADKKHAMAEAAVIEAATEAATETSTVQQDHDHGTGKLKEAREVLMRHGVSKEFLNALEEFVRAIK